MKVGNSQLDRNRSRPEKNGRKVNGEKALNRLYNNN